MSGDVGDLDKTPKALILIPC